MRFDGCLMCVHVLHALIINAERRSRFGDAIKPNSISIVLKCAAICHHSTPGSNSISSAPQQLKWIRGFSVWLLGFVLQPALELPGKVDAAQL